LVGNNLLLLYRYFLRNELAKNKQDFCNQLNIDYKSFSKYLNNKIEFKISTKNIKEFNKFKINLLWLFTGEGKMFNE